MSDEDVRLSQPALRVLRFLLANQRGENSGAVITKATGVGSGTLYPLLSRLEKAGWLEGKWEAIDPSEAGRPRQRFYELTGLGFRSAQRALAELQIPQGDLAWVS